MHHLCNTDIVFEHSIFLYLFYDILAGLLYY